MAENMDKLHITGNGITVYSISRLREIAETSSPIFVLIHGYPQSNLMFKHVIDRLPKDIPLFIPDIPGYGESTIDASHQKQAYSKREIGRIILDKLYRVAERYAPPGHQKLKIILIGHDRGARIAHRLAVDNDHPTCDIVGAVLIDIVPTAVQFQSLADPGNAAATFHWAFLAAEYPIPEEMITAFGGDKLVEKMMLKWTGDTEAGLARVKEALPVYKNHFLNRAVIDASCADYRAGATVDYAEQFEDQKNGKKLGLPTLVIYSKKYLGSRYDVEKVWKEWISDEGLLRTRGIGNGVGHFIPEEDPDAVTEEVLKWVKEALKLKI